MFPRNRKHKPARSCKSFICCSLNIVQFTSFPYKYHFHSNAQHHNPDDLHVVPVPHPSFEIVFKKIRFWTGFPHLVRPGLPVGLLSEAPQRFLWRSLRRLLSRFSTFLDLRHYCHQSNHRRITMMIDPSSQSTSFFLGVSSSSPGSSDAGGAREAK